MNVLRRFAVFVHCRAFELLLALLIILLIGQLTWPEIVRWWHLPSPGQAGFDTFHTSTLARKFVIQLPQSYHSRETWPLVIFLHGSGDRGNDPTSLLDSCPFRQELAAIVASPQCLPSFSWDPDTVAEFTDHVASRYHVDRRRIYLIGYSMGGRGAWNTAAAHSDLFAAIVPICGGGNPDDAGALTGIAVWAFHGEQDEVVPAARSKFMIEAIRNNGGQPKLTVLRNEGHGICKAVCERIDLWEWLLKQSK